MPHRRKWLLPIALLFSFSPDLARAQSPEADPVQRYASEGQAALAAGRYAEAEKAFEKLRELEPGTAEIHANLGAIYFQEKKFDQAVPALRRAIKLNPRLTKSRTLLAISLSELGQYTEAAPGLEKGFHDSTDAAVKRMCGLQLIRAYTGLQRHTKAVEAALELNRLYPDDPEILYHTGRLFGNFAFLSMRKLAEVAPGSIWRHQAAAEAFESQGSYDLAVREYKTVLELGPGRPGIHFRLGRTLLARSQQNSSPEDATEAAKEFERELELDPTNANAAYELADIHRNAGDFEPARQMFEQALRYYPDFEEAHLGLAAVLMAQQKPDSALPHLRKSIELNAGNEVSWYRLSQVQMMLGNSAEQQKAFAEFQRLRNEKVTQREAARELFSRSEVTTQKVDDNASK
ncbi:MAG: hypothetical protein NVS9B4_19750 [Candidatus Acidiferrum sp.]